MIFVRVRNRGTLPWLYLHAGHHDCMSKLQTAERDAQEGLVRLRCKAECFFRPLHLLFAAAVRPNTPAHHLVVQS